MRRLVAISREADELEAFPARLRYALPESPSGDLARLLEWADARLERLEGELAPDDISAALDEQILFPGGRPSPAARKNRRGLMIVRPEALRNMAALFSLSNGSELGGNRNQWLILNLVFKVGDETPHESLGRVAEHSHRFRIDADILAKAVPETEQPQEAIECNVVRLQRYLAPANSSLSTPDFSRRHHIGSFGQKRIPAAKKCSSVSMVAPLEDGIFLRVYEEVAQLGKKSSHAASWSSDGSRAIFTRSDLLSGSAQCIFLDMLRARGTSRYTFVP